MKAEAAYRTITEVSDLLQVPASVLRFWETQFKQIKPMKRMGRRYYQAGDVVVLAQIRDYLYKEGFTIKGVQKRLKSGSLENTEVQKKEMAAQDAFVREISEIKDYLADYI
ncbi:MAG: MerR family transcriptional regulator [Lactobacillales bacterium]|jgi:DNA-binding transcriptional MerR regulator|nr:MerR family transcriptional regulator [Lactobacillales bacterium]